MSCLLEVCAVVINSVTVHIIFCYLLIPHYKCIYLISDIVYNCAFETVPTCPELAHFIIASATIAVFAAPLHDPSAQWNGTHALNKQLVNTWISNFGSYFLKNKFERTFLFSRTQKQSRLINSQLRKLRHYVFSGEIKVKFWLVWTS